MIAVDVADDKLEFARSIGAECIINSTSTAPVEAILDQTGGGAHISIDALGLPEILRNSVNSLRKRGKHIQVGIMEADQHDATIPVGKIISRELAILGSHGMQPHRYPAMLDMIRDGRLNPQKLIGKTISLDEAPKELIDLNSFLGVAVTVIDSF